MSPFLHAHGFTGEGVPLWVPNGEALAIMRNGCRVCFRIRMAMAGGRGELRDILSFAIREQIDHLRGHGIELDVDERVKEEI